MANFTLPSSDLELFGVQKEVFITVPSINIEISNRSHYMNAPVSTMMVRRPPFIHPPINETTTPENEEVIELVYEILMPIVACLGIMGNILGYIILRQDKFSGLIFSYMKGLAFTDTMYLIFCLQVCLYKSFT